MPNSYIQKGSDNVNLQVSTYSVSGKVQSSGALVRPVPNATIKNLSVAPTIFNYVANFSVAPEESFCFYNNVGSAAITASLPSGVRNGFAVGFATVTAAMVIDPGGNDQIYLPVSGVRKLPGQICTLSANGSSAYFIHNSGTWYPLVGNSGTLI